MISFILLWLIYKCSILFIFSDINIFFILLSEKFIRYNYCIISPIYNYSIILSWPSTISKRGNFSNYIFVILFLDIFKYFKDIKFPFILIFSKSL